MIPSIRKPGKQTVGHILLFLIVVIIVTPYGVAAWNVQQGAHSFEQARPVCLSGQLTDTAQSMSIESYLREAITYLERARHWYQYHRGIYAPLASSYICQHDYDGAVASLRELARFPVYTPEELATQVSLYAQLYDLADSPERVMTDWRQMGITALDFVRAGRFYQEEEQSAEQAIRFFKYAALLDPTSSDAWYYLARNASQEYTPAEALQVLHKAITLNHWEVAGPSSAYAQIARIYRRNPELGSLEQALAALDKALGLNAFDTSQDKARGYYEKARILRMMNAGIEAYVKEYKNAIRADPGFSPARMQLGQIYYQELGDFKLAKAQFEAILQSNPDHDEAFYHLGEIYRLQGKQEKASEMYRKALQVRSTNDAAKQRLQELGYTP